MLSDRVIFSHLVQLPTSYLTPWLREAELLGDMPPALDRRREHYWPRAEDEDAAIYKWIGTHRPNLLPTLLRTVDLSNDHASELLYDTLRESAVAKVDCTVTFPCAPYFTDRRHVRAPQFPINALSVTSTVMTEWFVTVSAAHRPLGITFEPPIISLRQGSLQYGFSGGLLAVGAAILLACTEGVISSPSAYLWGSALAFAGSIELYLNWQKAISEREKLQEEKLKLRSERGKLEAERRKLLTEIERNERELREIDHPGRPIAEVGTRRAESAAVPRKIIQQEAERLGVPEAYANHIINRSAEVTGVVRSLGARERIVIRPGQG